MRRILPALLLAAFLFAAYTLGTVHTQPVQAASGAAAWEYAQVILVTSSKVIVVDAPDDDERVTLQKQMDALPENKIGNMTLMNVMGTEGWELVVYDNSQSDQGFLGYLFKRPVE